MTEEAAVEAAREDEEAAETPAVATEAVPVRGGAVAREEEAAVRADAVT